MAEQNETVNDTSATGAGPRGETRAASGAADDIATADGPAAPAAGVEAEAGPAANPLAEQRERYLRLAAEYDNFRKRTAKERQEASLRGQADMLKGMIDSLDDLGRFAHVDPATTDARTLTDGVSMVEKKLLKTLGGLGLEVLNPEGQPFDPSLHEAVSTEPAATREEDHQVSRVFQQGYLFNGQLLRPARVVVKQWNG